MMSTKKDLVVVDKSSGDLFAEFSLDELLSFESKLQENRMLALTHPVGKSCYYISESKEGALKEILKHRKEKEPRIQVIGLKTAKSAKLLDLSGKTNVLIHHLRLPAQNTGKITKEYLLPNFVAACCREVGIGGIRYQSTGYKCCVLWRDDYFEIIEGSQEVVPWSKLQAIDTSKNDDQNPFVPQRQLSA